VKYARLGRTGLTVSRLALGTANFGVGATEDESRAMLDRALDRGVNLVDTADTYGGRPGEGYCEQIIGRWLAEDAGRRGRVVLATKVYYGDTAGQPNAHGLSAYRIRKACEDSLRRLKTDHIDLYQMHHVDRTVPWAEIWQAMDQLVREGKVIYVGSSNFAGWHIAQASTVAAARDILGLVSEQSVYHLARRQVELEVLPACQALGMGFLPWSPLGGGLLCGADLSGPAGGGPQTPGSAGRRGDDRVKSASAGHAASLRLYDALCREMGARPADVALQWVLSREGVTSALIGPRTVAQLESCLRAQGGELTAEVLGRLDGIWPGPGGAAPEAYAF
jgi:aryl-alcohol dehydrogenase-like predicted oxidoreductase